MNNVEKSSRKEIVPSTPERQAEELNTPEHGRREKIDLDIEASRAPAKTTEELDVFQESKKAELARYVSEIEAGLGVPVSVESSVLIHSNVVEGPVGFAKAQHEKLVELRREKAGFAAGDAIAKLVPYNSPEMRGAIEGLSDEPYAYSPGGGIEMVGVRHTSDPESPMLMEVQQMRDKYVASTSKDEALFMIEGIYNAENLTPVGIAKMLEGVVDEAAAVRKYGENGTLLWMAREQGIEVVSPERPQDEIAAELLAQGYSREDMGLHLTIRQLTSEIGRKPADQNLADAERDFARMFFDFDRLAGTGWVTTETRQAVDAAIAANDMAVVGKLTPRVLEEYIGGANTAFGKLPGKEGQKLIPSIDGLLRRNKDVADPDKISMDVVGTLNNPRSNESSINRVSAAWNTERDKHLVRQIADAKAQGKKPFVVFGASHAVSVEQALKAL